MNISLLLQLHSPRKKIYVAKSPISESESLVRISFLKIMPWLAPIPVHPKEEPC